MYLAQRGDVLNRYDYSRFADSGKGEVLRYRRESPDDPATESIWVEAPQEYAVGFPAGHRQAAGGLDLQYGYDDQGNLNLQRLQRHTGQGPATDCARATTPPSRSSSPPAGRLPCTASRSPRRRWASGQRAAFRQLVRRFRRLLRRSGNRRPCRRRRDLASVRRRCGLSRRRSPTAGVARRRRST